MLPIIKSVKWRGLVLPLLLLLCVLPIAANAESETPADSVPSASITVSSEELLYAYDSMTVYNNGGTVYSTGAVVYNNGGTVYQKGGIVYNNGGAVYADTGRVFNNSGTAYRHQAEVLCFEENTDNSRVLGYYEFRFADYYEPYVTFEGLTVEPGSEKMIISEDSVCRITPREGYRIAKAKSDSGDISFNREDGSVVLSNVTADTTLTLTVRPAG